MIRVHVPTSRPDVQLPEQAVGDLVLRNMHPGGPGKISTVMRTLWVAACRYGSDVDVENETHIFATTR
jgi:hypothetical protein